MILHTAFTGTSFRQPKFPTWGRDAPPHGLRDVSGSPLFTLAKGQAMAKRKNRNGNGGSDAMGDALDSSDDLAMGADVSATDASDTGMGSDMDMSSDTGASGTSAHGAVDRLREGAAGASDRFRNSAEHLK